MFKINNFLLFQLFTKSNTIIQASILDMICQVLQLKVNYCLLDANGIFIDFILKLLESIETGIIRYAILLMIYHLKYTIHSFLNFFQQK